MIHQITHTASQKDKRELISLMNSHVMLEGKILLRDSEEKRQMFSGLAVKTTK